MCIALHPYWVGQPHRVRAFQSAMEYILSHPGVWLSTAREIADWFIADHLPPSRRIWQRGKPPMADRTHGMDHAHYTFRPLPDAPRFARVGIFRILEALDSFGLTPSVALGAAAAARYPELVDELLRPPSLFIAHGTFATRRARPDAGGPQPAAISSRLDAAEERALIAESRDAVAAATGMTPTGWCGQDFNESANTPAYLAEAGFDYTTDWLRS